MDIRVYTKTNCPHCVSAKTWLKQNNYEFEEISLDDVDARAEFLAANPDARSVPQIFVEGKRIGGFADLIKYNFNG